MINGFILKPDICQELANVIADIIMYEQQHKVQHTNIQQKINDKCNATGQFLSEKRHRSVLDGEELS